MGEKLSPQSTLNVSELCDPFYRLRRGSRQRSRSIFLFIIFLFEEATHDLNLTSFEARSPSPLPGAPFAPIVMAAAAASLAACGITMRLPRQGLPAKKALPR